MAWIGYIPIISIIVHLNWRNLVPISSYPISAKIAARFCVRLSVANRTLAALYKTLEGLPRFSESSRVVWIACLWLRVEVCVGSDFWWRDLDGGQGNFRTSGRYSSSLLRSSSWLSSRRGSSLTISSSSDRDPWQGSLEWEYFGEEWSLDFRVVAGVWIWCVACA